jgi:hypothetical protein
VVDAMVLLSLSVMTTSANSITLLVTASTTRPLIEGEVWAKRSVEKTTHIAESKSFFI